MFVKSVKTFGKKMMTGVKMVPPSFFALIVNLVSTALVREIRTLKKQRTGLFFFCFMYAMGTYTYDLGFSLIDIKWRGL